MLNVTETTKTAYYKDSVPKQLTITVPDRNITFTNSDIVQETLELEEMIETERYFTFKGCIATKYKFTIANVVTDLRGEYVEAKIQAADTEEIPIFKGYIDSQDNLTQEDLTTSFTCYDVLHLIGDRNMQSWLDSLTFPMTIKAYRDSLFANLGITQETAELVNDTLSISGNILNYYENPTALKIMQDLCQVSAAYGQIGRDGKFHYRKLKEIIKGLYPSDVTYPSDTTYPAEENANAIMLMDAYKTVEYQPYETEYIDKVSIFDQEGINQGNYGSGNNVFSISDNPLAFSVNMATAAQNIYNEIHVLWYIPTISLDCIGQPWLECGDSYVVQTKKNVVRSYIFARTLKGIQALFDTYQSDSDKVLPPMKATAVTRINSNRKSVLQIQADIVEMNTAIVNRLEADEAVVNQLSAKEANFETATAQNFQATNARVGTLEADHVSVASMNAANANISNLSGQVANLNTVVANKIDASTVYADFMEVSNWVSAGHIKADKIDANSFAGKTIVAESLNATGTFLTLKGYMASWKEITVVTGVNFTNKTVSTSKITYLGTTT